MGVSGPFANHRLVHFTKRDFQFYSDAAAVIHSSEQLQGLDKYSEGLPQVALGPPLTYKSIFGLPIFRPDSSFAVVWAVFVMILDASFTAVFVPWVVFFYGEVDKWDPVHVASTAVTCLYAADIIFEFHKGFWMAWSPNKRQLVMEGPLVARHYVLEGTFWVDTVALLPGLLHLLLGNEYRYVHLLRLLRLLRMVRVIPIVRAWMLVPLSSHQAPSLKFLATGLLLVAVWVYMLLVLVNFFACIWFFVGGLDHEGSWWSDVAGKDLTDAAIWDLYVASCYFIVTVFSTVGFGDITASNTPERLAAIIIMLMGAVLFGSIVGMMATVLQARAKSVSNIAGRYHAKLGRVAAFLEHHSVPHEEAEEVYRYYKLHWIWDTEEALRDNVFNELPPCRRAVCAEVMLREFISESPVLKALPYEVLLFLLGQLKLKCQPALHEIFRQEDPAECIYILQEGEVEFLDVCYCIGTAQAPMWLAGPLTLEGHGATGFLDVRYPYTAVARTQCRLWVLSLRVVQLVAREVLDFPALLGVELDASWGVFQDTSAHSPLSTTLSSCASSGSSLHSSIEQRLLSNMQGACSAGRPLG